MKLVVRTARIAETICDLTNYFSIGGNLNAASRQALMQKLARIDKPAVREEAM